jgi:hypothetical protein
MNKKDLQNAMNFYINHTEPIEDFARKAGELADRIHDLNGNGWTVATLEEVSCLVAWQARTFGGEWDGEMLAEIMDFMRWRVEVVYPDHPLPRIESPDERAKMITV